MMLVALVAGTGLAGILLSRKRRRAVKARAEREARRRASLIRQRLEEEPLEAAR